MKHTFILFILFSISIAITVTAEENRHNEPKTFIAMNKKDNKDSHNGRLRLPARHNEIECFYQDGYLHIIFEYPEGNATLSITDFIDTTYLIQQFSTFTPYSIYIGEIDQPLKITLTTESSIYEGILTL